MESKPTDRREDPTWETVLESLAGQGFLARFYRIPRHELAALMKLYSRTAIERLSAVVAATVRGEAETRDRLVDKLSPEVRYVMLAMMVRSMKCWVETETTTFSKGTRSSWRVAHS